MTRDQYESHFASHNGKSYVRLGQVRTLHLPVDCTFDRPTKRPYIIFKCSLSVIRELFVRATAMSTTLTSTVIDISNSSNTSSHANCSSTLIPNMRIYLLSTYTLWLLAHVWCIAIEIVARHRRLTSHAALDTIGSSSVAIVIMTSSCWAEIITTMLQHYCYTYCIIWKSVLRPSG